MQIAKIKLTLIIFSISIFSSILTGCATSGNAMPEGGPTMAEVYADAMRQSNGNTLENARAQVSNVQTSIAYDGTNHLSPYTRTSSNEINNLFPTLPNPQLVMYVYPHLAGNEQAPVPGYTTAFSLYDKTYYALPGELKN